jgi:hypothetical protein
MKTVSGGLVIATLLLNSINAHAQSFKDSIAAHRKKYVEELLAEPRQPLKPADVAKLSFYPADERYKVPATVTTTPGSKPFKIPTHSGKQKLFREYGTLAFVLNGEKLMLHAYQSVDMVSGKTNDTYLFVPFRDRTNYEDTYGGGRYIDLSPADIANGQITIDFNKAYNPYCAYSEGFNCPIPPDENTLPVEIAAGEKTFVH